MLYYHTQPPILLCCVVLDLASKYLAWKKDESQLLAECSRQASRRKRAGQYTSVHGMTGEGLLQEYFYTGFRQVETEMPKSPQHGRTTSCMI